MNLEKIKKIWEEIYSESEVINTLIKFLNEEKKHYPEEAEDINWYKNSVTYSLYVNDFSGDFYNLIEKIKYFKDLGVNCLWILPVLESPMKDQGFDISDYYNVRQDLGGNKAFFEFLKEAEKNGIKVIFDIAINHSSNEHGWFKDALNNEKSKYKDYYIWSENKEKYKEARILFDGIMESNWEYCQEKKQYYFHRFYEFQPDLNYKNPELMFEIIKILSFWKKNGIKGLRMDAIPFIWKKEGTNCEGLEKSHTILKLIRACLDYLSEGTILIAEANMDPVDLIKYFSNGDECQGAYHFPIMPMFYLSLAKNDNSYIREILDIKKTPEIPANCQWFTFVRCHDELTLEYVNEKQRNILNENYLKNKKYDFRKGHGISGRLFNILNKDTRKILNIYSMLFSLEGSPIIYYGDEIGEENNEDFYKMKTIETGYEDSRFFNRGKIKLEEFLEDKNSNSDKKILYNGIKKLISLRKKFSLFFSQRAEVKDTNDKRILYIIRQNRRSRLHIISNLSNEKISSNLEINGYNLLKDKEEKGEVTLNPYEYLWILEY